MENEDPKPSNDPSSSDPKDPVTTDPKDPAKGPIEDPKKDPQSEAYRKQQSAKDKALHESDDIHDRLEFLEGIAGESMKEKMVTEFVSEHQKDFPDVSADDLKELVNSPADFEKVAKFLQKKHEDIKQSTLSSVREVPDDSMTADEKQAEIDKIEPSDNSFGRWLHIASKKTRK